MATVSGGSAEKPARSNAFHFGMVIILIIISSVVSYWAVREVYFLSMPPASSAEAGPIDTLINFHFVVISVLFSLIMVFMIYALFAFRLQPGETALGQYMHGNTALEIAWIILPTIAVIAAAVWSFFMFQDLVADNENAMVVEVTGRQWSWLFTYPEADDKVSQVLVLPVDQPIRLEMQSGDVLHSFWVTEFRIKQDLLPAPQTTTLRITPTVIGEYKVRCAEICGTAHHSMRAWVVVLSQADYDTWDATGELPEAVAEITREIP